MRMTISKNCPPKEAQGIREALARIKYINIEYDMVDHGPKTDLGKATSSIGGAPCGKSPLVDAINLLCYTLEKNQSKYFDLHIRSKAKGSRSSYTVKKPLRDYLGELCIVPEYKYVLTGQINNIVKFLTANPKYQGITSIKIDHNLIEVSSCCCLYIVINY